MEESRSGGTRSGGNDGAVRVDHRHVALRNLESEVEVVFELARRDKSVSGRGQDEDVLEYEVVTLLRAESELALLVRNADAAETSNANGLDRFDASDERRRGQKCGPRLRCRR